MNVFITGATGYIGFNVANAMRRAGHRVWGLVRSEKKGRRLAKHEIIPVVGDMQTPNSYHERAEQCSMLIHAAADYSKQAVSLDRKAVETFLTIGERGASPKTVIYTSGCWVLGDTGNKMATETAPLKPIEAVSWRPEHENLVLKADHFKGLVLRPGCVYGKSGGLTAQWFSGVKNDSLEIVGDGSNYWTMVHIDDLVDAYVRLAESGLAGEDFNISDRSHLSVKEMVEAVVKVTGYDGKERYIPLQEAEKEMGSMAEALALNQYVDAGKAERLLRWRPRHHGFIEDIDLFYGAWKASNKG